ncbi:MAG TPA: hypothetical protein VF424_01110 [Vicinamibacterales bacterium]
MTRTTRTRRRWPVDDLIRRVCDALDIAANALEVLASEGFTSTEEPGTTVRPEKVIAESAVLLLAASAVARHDAVRCRVNRVVERLAPHARSDRMLLAICTEPALAWDYALAHVCLTRLGHPDERFDSVLELIARAQTRNGHERPAHRVLEQRWIMRGLQLAPSGESPAVRTLPTGSGSVLAWPVDLLSGNREDIYAFTHALMYVTDFNLHPGRLPRSRKTILGEAEVMLARCLDEEDYDLAGEVLLAWPLTGRSWGTTATFGFQLLASVEDRAGFLPSAGLRPEHLNTLSAVDRRKYLLATAYHTAYVMGLLCAAALHRLPPVQLKVGPTREGIGRVLLAKLDADCRRPHWREAIEPLAERQHDGLASMFLAIGLRRSVVRRDFARLHDFLKTGLESGLVDSPAASQAAELLARLGRASEAATA